MINKFSIEEMKRRHEQQMVGAYRNYVDTPMMHQQDALDALGYAMGTKTKKLEKDVLEDRKRMQHLQMLGYRLRIEEGNKIPLDHLDVYVTNEVAMVFAVKGNQGVVLKDDPALFPSDTLIAELRLIIG